MEQTTNKRSRMLEKQDLLTSLPIDLAHSIISLLPTKYAARSMVISREWGLLWNTSPVINLDENDFKDDVVLSREKFIRCLFFLLVQHRLSNLQKLRIRTFPYRHSCTSVHNLIDILLGVVARNNVLKEIDLEISRFFLHPELAGGDDIPYAIPKVIFSLTKLVCLKIEGCEMRAHDVIKLPLLKTLSMKNVLVVEDFLQNLMLCCPALETLVLRMCYELETIEIRHSKLGHLDIGKCEGLESLLLDVPSLLSFKYKECFWSGHGVFQTAEFKDACSLRSNNLRSIFLKYVRLQAKALYDIVSTHTDLENVKLKHCKVSGRPQIHSDSLKTLLMTRCYFEVDADIKAPNLESITLQHNLLPIKLSGKIFQSLTSLFLVGIDLEDEDMSFTDSNFPGLVSLTLKLCKGFKQLTVISSTVKYLAVIACTLKRWNIFALCLSRLVYTGSLLKSCSMISSNKLDVILQLRNYGFSHHHDKLRLDKLKQFLKMFTEIRDLALTMTLECPECLLIFKDVTTAPIDHIKDLKVKIEDDEATDGEIGLIGLLCGILCVTQCCNSMSLEIESFTISLEFDEIGTSDICEIQNSLRSCLVLVRNHLVKLTVKNFGGHEQEVMMLVGFLLRKALCLRHVGIFMGEGGGSVIGQSGLKAWIRGLPNAFPSIAFWETNFGHFL